MKSEIKFGLILAFIYLLGVVTPFILGDLPKKDTLEIYVVDNLGSNILFVKDLTVTNERDNTVTIFKDKESLSEYLAINTAYTVDLVPNEQYRFIWNDDEESIPVEGTPVLLESIDGNTIYLSPIDNN